MRKILCSLDGCKEGFYNEIVLGWDPYLMREWKHDFFDVIFDIHDNFDDSHDVKYRCSNGRAGFGTYILLNKNGNGRNET